MNGDSRVQWGDGDDKQGGTSGVIEIDSRVTAGQQEGDMGLDRGVAAG